jgi:hypothetical protein
MRICFFDFGHRLGRLHIGHRAANNLAAGLFQLVNLPDGCRYVPGVRLGHRLHGNIGPATDLHAADIDRLGNSASVHNVALTHPQWLVESTLKHGVLAVA